MIFLDGRAIMPTKFPNGEVGFQYPPYREIGTLSFKYETDADLLHLKFIKDHLELVGTLVIQYMPYSRMDRVQGDHVFTLRSVADFINSMNFRYVEVIEPHSDVTVALLDRAVARYPTVEQLGPVMTEIGFDPQKDYLVFPDAGAEKRYAHLLHDLDTVQRTLVGMKQRDFDTGRITRMAMWPERGPNERSRPKAIIIDDLCSYGGTFDLCTSILREEYDVNETYLIVAHCEDNVYDGRLLDNPTFKGLYTTDTIHTHGNSAHAKIHLYEWRHTFERLPTPTPL